MVRRFLKKDVVDSKAQLQEIDLRSKFVECHVPDLKSEIKSEPGYERILSIPHDRLVDEIIVMRPLGWL